VLYNGTSHETATSTLRLGSGVQFIGLHLGDMHVQKGEHLMTSKTQEQPVRSHRPIWIGIAAVVGVVILVAAGAWVVVERANSPLHTMEVSSGVHSVAFSPEGSIIASGSGDGGTVHLWDAATATLQHTLSPASFLRGNTHIAFSPDGSVLASGTWPDSAVRLWDVRDGTLLQTLETNTDQVFSVAFSPDGRILASASHDRTVRLWDATDGTLLYTLEGHTDDVSSVVFSADGSTLISGAWDDTVRLWDVRDGTLLHILEDTSGSVYDVALSPDGTRLATALHDGVWLWRTPTE